MTVFKGWEANHTKGKVMEDVIVKRSTNEDILTFSIKKWREDTKTGFPVYAIQIQWSNKMNWCLPPISPVLADLSMSCMDTFAWSRVPYGDTTYRHEGGILTTCVLLLRKQPEKSTWILFLEAFASQTELRTFVPYRLIQSAPHPDRAGRTLLSFYDDTGGYVELPVDKYDPNLPPSTIEGTFLSKEIIERLETS